MKEKKFRRVVKWNGSASLSIFIFGMLMIFFGNLSYLFSFGSIDLLEIKIMNIAIGSSVLIIILIDYFLFRDVTFVEIKN